MAIIVSLIKFDLLLIKINFKFFSSIRPYVGTRENVTHFSTSGLDGKLVIWDLESLENQFRKLKV